MSLRGVCPSCSTAWYLARDKQIASLTFLFSVLHDLEGLTSRLLMLVTPQMKHITGLLWLGKTFKVTKPNF